MRVLVACEYSGVVREAFRKYGHKAISCDLLPTEIPGPHLQCDVLSILNDGWDLMIAHPPCTFLACSGARWFKDVERKPKQKQALDFVYTIMESKIPRVAIENPISIISTYIKEPTQIIQPWMFGDECQKTTCLWLKNLPKLKPTKIVSKGGFVVTKSGKVVSKFHSDTFNLKVSERGKVRSKTFQGIAEAMADQWGNRELPPIVNQPTIF
jgi:hypothetical protein